MRAYSSVSEFLHDRRNNKEYISPDVINIYMEFSIVIPAYNGEQYLKLTIESSLNQRRKADEIIVVDDGSTDRTAEIAKSSVWSGQIKYFYNGQSTGFVDAWNRGIRKANGEFVAILHQDDLIHPEYLYRVEKALQRYSEVKHLYTGCNYVDEKGDLILTAPGPHSLEPILYSGKHYGKNYLNGVINNRHIHRCPGVMTSRDLLLNECTYRKEAGHIADDDFFYRVGLFTDVVGISHPLASYRIHSRSTTSQLDLLTLKLAEDYLFQTLYYRDNKSPFENQDIENLNKHTAKFINLLLFQSILYKQKDWAGKAFQLRHKIDDILPGFMERNIPLWAKLLWKIGSFEEKSFAKLYVGCLNKLIAGRDLPWQTTKV